MTIAVDLLHWCQRSIPAAVGLTLLQVFVWSFDWKLGLVISVISVRALQDEPDPEGRQWF
ncbi:hypothetical protein HY374_00410 [Candidatus Berkelbacteria bacterium]|nr:hypothetical protein [Candidatus Berkelbacteria bacterium]